MVPDIPAEVPAGNISPKDSPHFADVPLSPVTNAKVDLPIGQDQPYLLVPMQICRSDNKAGQPYATRTKLGWALQGPVDEYIGSKACRTTNHINNIENESESTLSGEDQSVYDMMHAKTELNGNRYTVPIPWRPGLRLRFGNDGTRSTSHDFRKGRNRPRRLPM